ncbi:50S ribosomal protein L33 [Mesomycoplasma bovoculi]|uniref:Large ribosomal subunit protein bL33 n=1 Tax=Mesomycoplasma bovoculi M165/69 TaxID=743966 RepID=W5UTF9_9BACT|nr:50S ribosomal protein L33 [Mesomycoplasma bovoculi]AHH45514.1 ribosomal protein L33 [Mesomycoplasma bovoculi M165/69]
MKKKILLSCSVCNSRNYSTNKSISERLVLQKFCSKCNAKRLHKEEK